MPEYFLFFRRSSPNGRPWSQALLAETVETGDKNSDHFRCMQKSLDEVDVVFRCLAMM